MALSGCLDKAGSAGSSGGGYSKSTAASANGPLWRFHFIGMTELNQSTNASKLKEVWSLPASQDLKKQALDKIAKTPFQLWQKSLPSGTTDQAALIRPLLDDFITSESYVDLKGPSADYDSVIALRLDPDRARLWETNLSQLLSAWKFPKAQPLNGGVPGWEARARGVTVQFRHRGNWLLVSWSQGKLGAINSLSTALEQSSRPIPALTSSVLELQADLPLLGRWSPILAKHKLPPVDIALSPRGEYIRTEGRIHLSEPLAWKPEPWRIPTNLVSDPLVSFSVAQGIAPLLEGLPGYKELGIKKTPSQVCAWSQGPGTFRTYWAFPMNDASNVVRRVEPNFTNFLKHYLEEFSGKLTYMTNDSALVWTGLPLMMPAIKSAVAEGTDYLQLCLLPPPRRQQPIPPELLTQLQNRTDILYYDWEITGERASESKLLFQVIDMLHLRTLAATNAPTSKLFEQAGKRLGNTVTEVSAVSPRELKLVRKSHVGLTGFELALLLRWIDSPLFPLGYEPPASIRHKPGSKPIPAPNPKPSAR